VDRAQLSTIASLGVFRPSDLEAAGIPRRRLYSLLSEGRIERLSRGLYASRRHRFTEHHALALVCRRVPHAVVCLLSALRFHDLTTQLSASVWIAIPEKARRPHLEDQRLSVCRFSGAALEEGVETHDVEGVPVRVTGAARTVVDCFRYRNKIGIDVAIEALKDFTRKRRSGASELARHARARGVSRIMQTYLDAIA
jgi:predicted transcriptional regulator of viral defense system